MFQTIETRATIGGRSGIYIITLRGANRHYVGQSVNLWKRMRKHVTQALNSNSKREFKIARAIRKYGPKAFEFSILCFCDPGSLDTLEGHYLKLFRGVSEGFNLASDTKAFGRGLEVSQQTREKLSKANIGQRRSDEMRERMREAALERDRSKEKPRGRKARKAKVTPGAKRPNPNTPERRQATRERMLGKKLPEHWRNSINQAMQMRCKPVKQLNLDGTLVATYPSVKAAVAATKCAGGNIAKACKQVGRVKTCGGFIWKYAEATTN